MPLDLFPALCHIEGKTLKTLDLQRPFTILRVTPKRVVVRVEARGRERPIRFAEIEGAFLALIREGHISRVDIEARFSPRNPAYVAAILSRLPDVTYTRRPIVLWHRSARQASLLPLDENEGST